MDEDMHMVNGRWRWVLRWATGLCFMLVCETQQYLAVYWLVTVTYETMNVTFSVISCIQRQ